MNPPQSEKKMTSSIVFSFMYSAESIHAFGWGGTSLVAVLASTATVVLSFDAAAASLLLKRGRSRCPKVSEWAGLS